MTAPSRRLPFDAIWPGGGPAKWTRGLHSTTSSKQPYPLKGGGLVVLHEHCYGMFMSDPDKREPLIWKQRTWPGTAYIRHNTEDAISLFKYRTFAEHALYVDKRGIGRTCLDFWDVLRTRSGEGLNIYNRYPFSSCAQRAPSMYHLSWPGPEGAEPTMRFQLLIESIQTAEAIIVVAEAQAEKADRLGPDLTARCRQVFIDRLNYTRQHLPEPWSVPFLLTFHQGWQDLDARLFALAAEAAAKMK